MTICNDTVDTNSTKIWYMNANTCTLYNVHPIKYARQQCKKKKLFTMNCKLKTNQNVHTHTRRRRQIDELRGFV